MRRADGTGAPAQGVAPRSGAGRVERAVCWAALAVAVVVALVVVRDCWDRVGRVAPGFAVMENGQVGPGGAPRGELEPLDVITDVNGHRVAGARDILAEVRRHPPGTPLTYGVRRSDACMEVTVPTRLITRADFGWSLLDGTLPGLLVLGLGALVLALRPGTPESRVFLAFCLASALINLTYIDLVSTYRFTRLLLTLWAFVPALLLHLAATFPERRALPARFPALLAVPYLVSAALAVWLHANFTRFTAPVGETIAVYTGLAALVLLGSLAWTWRSGATVPARRRARVLLAGLGMGYAVPALGTSAEIFTGSTVPHLHLLWQLNFLFPAAVAYAMVRYQLFDVRAVIRVGVVYSAVTALVALAYVGLLTGLDLFLGRLELAVTPVVGSAAVALAIVLLMNPVYGRVRTLVDRLFFRSHYDAQRALESLGAQMTTLLEPDRLEALVTGTADEIFRPADITLLMPTDGPRGFRGLSRAGRAVHVAEGAAVLGVLDRLNGPVTRPRLFDDPDLVAAREPCLAELRAAGAEALVPVRFRGHLVALIALGRRRGDTDYSGEDLRVLRALANQSAVALENARAYGALQAALRRVQILESIRANLAQFVPRAVHDLIELAPEAPALAKKDVDVSVLFVDVVGYSRLAERLDSARLNRLIERYFGTFLDEILAQGGDVNETAGDGLMVIFQDADPRRHAVAAVLAAQGVLRRTAELNAEPDAPAEPVAVHLGVNSGTAALGATRIEGTAGTRLTYTASGPVTNLAARLAALGEGDAVVIGAETRRRLGPEFAAEDIGEQRLKNIDEPVRAYRLPGPRVPALADVATGR